MTKKHFIELADVLRMLKHDAEQYGPEAVDFYGCTVAALGDFCARQNSRFDRNRWLDYIAGKCGPNGGRVKKAA